LPSHSHLHLLLMHIGLVRPSEFSGIFLFISSHIGSILMFVFNVTH